MNSKGFFLGLGLGFIVVSFLFLTMYFFIPRSENSVEDVLSNDEIIDKARTLGMIFPSEHQPLDNVILKARELGMVFPDVITGINNNVDTAPLSDNISDDEPPVNTSDDLLSLTSSGEEEIVSIIIYAGYSANSVAELLFSKDIIDSASGFENFLIRNNATTKLRTGSYYLPKGSSYEFVLDALTQNSR